MEELIEIFEGCKTGDRKSQERLYHKMYPALFSLCKNLFSDEQDIISALNNGMLKVYRNIEQYDDSKGKLFNWIYTIVRNEAITYLKGKKCVEQNIDLEYGNHIMDENPFKFLEWKDIYYYLNQLPQTTRSVCSLFYFEHFSIKEIALSLEMKEGTVKWHLNESRNRLKKIFKVINHI